MLLYLLKYLLRLNFILIDLGVNMLKDVVFNLKVFTWIKLVVFLNTTLVFQQFPLIKRLLDLWCLLLIVYLFLDRQVVLILLRGRHRRIRLYLLDLPHLSILVVES